MKRKLKITLSSLLIVLAAIAAVTIKLPVKAVEIYDYSGFWALGNAKLSVDSQLYICAFSGSTGYGGVVFPDVSSFSIACNYRIFASCAAGGRFYYFTEISKEYTDCNIVVYDANSGLTDIFAVADINVSSNDMVAADTGGNIYFVNADNGSLVKCFAMSGKPCAEFSLGGYVYKLITAGGGRVLAVCSNGNYLLSSSGSCSYVGGGSGVYASGNGYFSDAAGNVYGSSLNSVFSAYGPSAYTPRGYAVYSGGVIDRLDSSGKPYERADCIDRVSGVYAVGDTVITFNGAGVFNAYGYKDFYGIQEETTAPPTQAATEEITRPTEPPQDKTEPEETEASSSGEDDEKFVFSVVYSIDDEEGYVTGVSPSTTESNFIKNFSVGSADYILQRNSDTTNYIANGDIISFISEKQNAVYRIVVTRDFNCDGKFNDDDIEAMAYLILDGGSIYEWQLKCADMDQNGEITLSDLYDCYLNS